MRELKSLKITADYSASDPTGLDKWLMGISPELSQYTYYMLRQGVDKYILPNLSDLELREECCIQNSIHRRRILQHTSGEIFCATRNNCMHKFVSRCVINSGCFKSASILILDHSLTICMF